MSKILSFDSTKFYDKMVVMTDGKSKFITPACHVPKFEAYGFKIREVTYKQKELVHKVQLGKGLKLNV